jgi:hypothetical protein
MVPEVVEGHSHTLLISCRGIKPPNWVNLKLHNKEPHPNLAEMSKQQYIEKLSLVILQITIFHINNPVSDI